MISVNKKKARFDHFSDPEFSIDPLHSNFKIIIWILLLSYYPDLIIILLSGCILLILFFFIPSKPTFRSLETRNVLFAHYSLRHLLERCLKLEEFFKLKHIESILKAQFRASGTPKRNHDWRFSPCTSSELHYKRGRQVPYSRSHALF